MAAQQFDPAGWAEQLFAHACMLARAMGLHHSQLVTVDEDSGSDETIERAKVLRSLYVRDRSLCTTRGSVSWLPSYDCELANQLRTAVKHQACHSDRLQLALIQEEIYRLTYAVWATPSPRLADSKESQRNLQTVKGQLDQFAHATDVFHIYSTSTLSMDRVLTGLEFLATRILALQHHGRYAEQVRADSRASCLLLIIAHGDPTGKFTDAFHAATGTTNKISRRDFDAAPETSFTPFKSTLDAFSIPAFFILLDGLVNTPKDEQPSGDLVLLYRVSECYKKHNEHMLTTNYHCKVARTFNQLLDSIDLFREAQQPSQASEPPSRPSLAGERNSLFSQPPPLDAHDLNVPRRICPM